MLSLNKCASTVPYGSKCVKSFVSCWNVEQHTAWWLTADANCSHSLLHKHSVQDEKPNFPHVASHHLGQKWENMPPKHYVTIKASPKNILWATSETKIILNQIKFWFYNCSPTLMHAKLAKNKILFMNLNSSFQDGMIKEQKNAF